MNAPVNARHAGETVGTTLVWIDAREAVIATWRDGGAALEHVDSEVPDHRRSTGHVRHRPAVGYGGGGTPRAASEPHRMEHLARFVEVVAERLPETDDLVILGPGTVRLHLERDVLEADRRRGRGRSVSCEPADVLTDRQLVARLRTIVGDAPRRREPAQGRLPATPGR